MYKKYCLLILSFIIVAFGQPSWIWWLGLMASVVGYACCWIALLMIPRPAERFCVAMGWFTSVQIVQLSWAISHPFSYIYAVLFLLAWIMGAQFGLLALWITPKNWEWPKLLAMAGFWTLMEWSRLFIFSGLSFNPAGLALTGALYPLQLASIGGVYFLSFYVILTNLVVLRAWMEGFKKSTIVVAVIFILFPYLFGWGHVSYHERGFAKDRSTLSVLLVQPGFPLEENISFQSGEEARKFVLDEWKTVVGATRLDEDKKIDLIVLPEYLVPYGTFYPVFPLEEVHQIFTTYFGMTSRFAMPPLENSLLASLKGDQWFVSNGFMAQTLANLFHADLIVGFEDSVYVDDLKKRHESYSAAFHFKAGDHLPVRYEKRILLPMGEYIPFDWCRDLAARYGIGGSFTPGKEAKVFEGSIPMSPTICYEETFGDLIRESRVKGAELLVNLTNDGWYPNSRLPQQHFDHSLLRTVENGVPLVRACNTGLTGAIDSLGRIIGLLGADHYAAQQLTDSLRLDVPTYHYHTLYTIWGDTFILAICVVCLVTYCFLRWKS